MPRRSESIRFLQLRRLQLLNAAAVGKENHEANSGRAADCRFRRNPSFAAQTPPPAPVTDRKAEPKKRRRPSRAASVAQEQQKQDSQKKDAPAPPLQHSIAESDRGRRRCREKEDKKWTSTTRPGRSTTFRSM